MHPSPTSYPQAAQGNEEWGLWSAHNASSLPLLNPLPSLPRDYIIPKLIPIGFPQAPTQLHTTGPPFWCCSTWFTTSSSSPRPPVPLQAPLWSEAVPAETLHGQRPPSGHIHCYTVGSSAASWGDPALTVLLGCRGMVCSSTGLSWTSGSCCSTPGAPPALLLH